MNKSPTKHEFAMKRYVEKLEKDPHDENALFMVEYYDEAEKPVIGSTQKEREEAAYRQQMLQASKTSSSGRSSAQSIQAVGERDRSPERAPDRWLSVGGGSFEPTPAVGPNRAVIGA